MVDVVGIGNANIDIIMSVPHQAANDEKVLVNDLKELPGGGAANFIVGVTRQGHKGGFIGYVGNDFRGTVFKESLKKEGVDISHLKQSDKYSTGLALIINGLDGTHVLYSYRGANSLLSENDLDFGYIRDSKVFHLSSIKPSLLIAAAEVRSKVDTKLSVDPGRNIAKVNVKEYQKYLQEIDILFMNKLEFSAFTGLELTKEHVVKIAKKFSLVLSVQNGAKGSIISDGKRVWKIDAFDVKVVDTTGAGDAYSAGFISGYLRGFDIKTCGILGTATAAIKIQKLGGREGLPTLSELSNFLEERKLRIF